MITEFRLKYKVIKESENQCYCEIATPDGSTFGWHTLSIDAGVTSIIQTAYDKYKTIVRLNQIMIIDEKDKDNELQNLHEQP